ncbi:MAG: coenzyme F420-0:L-glutamate ligase [Thermoprotei archaeon]
MKIEIYGLKINVDISPGIDLAKLIVDEAEKQAYGVKEDDVIVVTSKIVSKAEGRIYRFADVQPSRRAKALSRIYHKDAREIELILRNSDSISFIIPIYKFMKIYGKFFKDYARDERTAAEIIRKDPYIFMTSVKGMLLTDAGLDFSNSPEGYCTLPPKDPDESAKRMRERIRELTNKEVAIVITDTEWKLDKFGSIDIAIGSSGIQPVSRNFASKDLYGKPKFGGVDNLTDLVSATANLLFGQTNEAIPVVIIRGLKYERSEKGIKDVIYGKALRRAFRMAIWENVKFKLLLLLLSLLNIK